MEMTEKYLSKPDYTYEKVMRYSSMASKPIDENRFWTLLKNNVSYKKQFFYE